MEARRYENKQQEDMRNRSQESSNMTEARQIEDHLAVYNIGSFENYKSLNVIPSLLFYLIIHHYLF